MHNEAIIKYAAQAGQIMLEAGGETYRVDPDGWTIPESVEQARRFASVVDDFHRGRLKAGSVPILGDRPSRILRAFNIPDKPLAIAGRILRKISGEKHAVPRTTVERLPELLADPIALLRRIYPKAPSLPFYDKVERLVNTIHRYPLRALVSAPWPERMSKRSISVSACRRTAGKSMKPWCSMGGTK